MTILFMRLPPLHYWFFKRKIDKLVALHSFSATTVTIVNLFPDGKPDAVAPAYSRACPPLFDMQDSLATAIMTRRLTIRCASSDLLIFLSRIFLSFPGESGRIVAQIASSACFFTKHPSTDVNYIDHTGCMMRQKPHEFDVFTLQRVIYFHTSYGEGFPNISEFFGIFAAIFPSCATFFRILPRFTY